VVPKNLKKELYSDAFYKLQHFNRQLYYTVDELFSNLKKKIIKILKIIFNVRVGGGLRIFEESFCI
jgi:hypothetical protein